jgi:hypothetical protein
MYECVLTVMIHVPCTICQVIHVPNRPAPHIIRPENESVTSGLVSVHRLLGRPVDMQAGVKLVHSI